MALDLSKVKEAAAKAPLPTNHSYPSPVAGRVAHIDADFMAYQVSAESAAELDVHDPRPRKTLEVMRHNAYEAVDHIRKMARAETAVLHTTSNSDKGGRDDHAILKAYQANRKDRDNRPEHLDAVREWLGNGVGDDTGLFVGYNHTDQEADDGMTQAHYADPVNTIICSADKDLDMVPGWRMDMTDYTIDNLTDSFGSIWLKDMISPTTGKKYATKCVGRGTKFFWSQLLQGDGADNISGLPLVAGSMWQQADGSKAFAATLKQFIACDDPVQSEKLNEKLKLMQAKTKPCGPVMTFKLLDIAKTDREAYKIVRMCYERLATEHDYTYTHWSTGAAVTPTQALLSEMRLLWMRRYKKTDDVIDWLKETLNAK